MFPGHKPRVDWSPTPSRKKPRLPNNEDLRPNPPSPASLPGIAIDLRPVRNTLSSRLEAPCPKKFQTCWHATAPLPKPTPKPAPASAYMNKPKPLPVQPPATPNPASSPTPEPEASSKRQEPVVRQQRSGPPRLQTMLAKEDARKLECNRVWLLLLDKLGDTSSLWTETTQSLTPERLRVRAISAYAASSLEAYLSISSLSLTMQALRRICWTTKTSRSGQPFAVTLTGVSGRGPSTSWCLAYLTRLHASWLATERFWRSSSEPDFMLPILPNWSNPSQAGVAFQSPMSYTQALPALRSALQLRKAALPSALDAQEALNFTLHGLKVGLLSPAKQLRLPADPPEGGPPQGQLGTIRER